MRVLRTAALALFALATVPNSALSEAEQIGTATRIKTSVNGDYGSVEVSEPVHRNERITTSKSGLGEFLFRDGTKLAVGWGSVVKIDKYVFDDSNSVKKLTIRAAKGTFRWISGNSKSTAYSILTPAGTIGVRGTKFDFYVAPDGTVGLVMLSGSAQFCGAGGCIALTAAVRLPDRETRSKTHRQPRQPQDPPNVGQHESITVPDRQPSIIRQVWR